MKESLCQEDHYQRIFNDNADKLRNFMYYRCGELEKAEDLMQEAFIRLWENCKKVLIEKAKSYVFTTANRLFLNDLEHNKVVLNFAKNNAFNSTSESPEFILEEKEFKEQLEAAISALPDSQREVFLMNRIDKLSFQEIADIQGVSIGAVHKKMYKAMDKLKNSVEILNNRKI